MTRISRVLFLGSVVLIEHYPLAHHRAGYPDSSQLHARWILAAADRRTTDLAACSGAHKVLRYEAGHRYLMRYRTDMPLPQYFP